MTRRPNPSPQRPHQASHQSAQQWLWPIVAIVPVVFRYRQAIVKLLGAMGAAGFAMKGCQMWMQADSKIQGMWRVAGSSGPIETLFFQADKTVVWIMPSQTPSGRRIGYAIPYTIDSSKIPMALNLQPSVLGQGLPPVKILFTLTPDGQQLIGAIDPNESGGWERLNGVMLKKVPEVRSLPSDVRIVMPGTGSQAQQDYQGRQLMVSLSRIVEQRMVRSGRYLPTAQEQRSGLGLRVMSESHEVALASIAVDGRKVTYVAQSKSPSFKSYAATTFIRANGQPDTVMCESVQPNTASPYIAGFPIESVESFNCPNGSLKF